MNDALRMITLRAAVRVYHSARRTPGRIEAWRRFWNDYSRYQELELPEHQKERHVLMPHVDDATATTPIEPTYFYQGAWAFERIVTQPPERHIDVGSHHTFVALLSKVLPLTMVDLRPLSLPLDSVDFVPGSILELPFANASIESISSLCVVEHIGLGRYGDPLDPDGSAKAIRELVRVVAPGGRLYLSAPIGDRLLVAFNAGRVLTREFVLEQAAPLELVQERYIVGTAFTDTYAAGPAFSVTGLYEFRGP